MPARRSATWSTKLAPSRADLSPATRAPIPWRVAVSTAVSCQTGPTPSGLPTEKVSRATKSPGRAAKWQHPTGPSLAGVVTMPWSPRAAGPGRPPAGPDGRAGAGAGASASQRPIGAPHARPGARPGAGRRWWGGPPPRPAPPRPGRVGWRSAAPVAGGLGQQRGQPRALGAAGPAVLGGPRDAKGRAGLGDAGLAGPVQDLDTPVVDELCWGHGGGLLRLFSGTKGSTTSPTNGGTCNLIP